MICAATPTTATRTLAPRRFSLIAQAMAMNTSNPNALCRICMGLQDLRSTERIYGRSMVKTLSTTV